MRTIRYLPGLLLVLIFVGLGLGIAPAGAQQPLANPVPLAARGTSSAQAAKINADLLRRFSTLAPGGKTTYWVVLADQADTSNAIPTSNWAAKGWYVYNALRAKADATQKPLLAQLKTLQTTGNVSTVESFWIINLISVTGDLASAQAMAASPLVTVIKAPEDGTITGGPQALSPAAEVVLDQAARQRPTTAFSLLAPLLVQHNISEVRAPQAWTLGYDGTGIVVGSMDTGVLWTHEALTARYRGNANPPDPNIHDYNWYDGYLMSATPLDQNAHGTHTMGTAVGNQLSGSPYGNIGVGKGAQWITVRICGLNGSSSCDGNAILRGFQWTLAPTRVGGTLDPRPDLRPRVSSNSWGGGSACDSTYNTAVQNWVNSGIFPDFATGNSGPGVGTVGSPANAPLAWGTGNLNTSSANWLINVSSSRGPSSCDQSIRPHVVAPGTSICSSVNSSDTAYNCSYTGTSMATPHIAGAVAVLLDKNENLTIAQLMFAMTSTAFFSPTWGVRPNNDYGWGLLQLDAALNSVPAQGTPTPTRTGTPPTATPTRTPSPTPCFGPPATYTSTDVPKNIPDNGVVTSTLTIAGNSGPITDLDLVGLNITHTWISDLRISLTSPQNSTVILVNRICSSEDNFTNNTLDDEASTAIGSTCPPAAGASYQPSNPLSAFDGQNPTGVWTLTIEDLALQDIGTLNAWGLRVSGPCVTPTATRTPTNVPTITPSNTPTRTPTNTPTPVCTPAAQGHLTYQGLGQPNPGNVQPITLQLQSTGGGPVNTYTTNTDASGTFFLALGTLAPGSYNYRIKGPRYLATGGTLTFSGCVFTQEFGTQRAGDINNDNCVDVSDFTLLRASFGKACGDPGFNPTADYNNDCVVDTLDFGLLRSNFGTCGAPVLTLATTAP